VKGKYTRLGYISHGTYITKLRISMKKYPIVLLILTAWGWSGCESTT